LDGVLFEDGHFAGPDQAGTFVKLRDLRTKRRTLRADVEALTNQPEGVVREKLQDILTLSPLASPLTPDRIFVESGKKEMALSLIVVLRQGGATVMRDILSRRWSDAQLAELIRE
jgi:hypothetical protein